MARTVKEWVGRTDDSKAPPRVRQRCYDREQGICYLCETPIQAAKGFELDHKKALIKNGENRESNLFPVHKHCHKIKTAQDNKDKAKTARIKGKHIGAIQPKGNIQSRGFAQSEKTAKIDKTAIDALAKLPRRSLYS